MYTYIETNFKYNFDSNQGGLDGIQGQRVGGADINIDELRQKVTIPESKFFF